MIKILHVISELSRGGASRAAYGLAKYTGRGGKYSHRIVSLLPFSDAGVDALAADAGMDVLKAPEGKSFGFEIKKADIVLVHWWNNPFIYNFLRSELPDVRLAIWFHVAGDQPPQVVTDQLVSFADFALAGSPFTYEQPAFQNLPARVKDAKTGMVYDPADFERLKDVQLQAHAGFRVGYVGTVNPVKMHPNYVAMSAAVDIPQVQFVVCGSGGAEAIFKQQAAQLGKEKSFDFTGYVEDIRPVLETFDVFGYPLCDNTYAAAELVLQEAMFAGIPPVVFPFGGVKRLVENGQTGLVVNSEEEYSRAIEFLYHNPEERKRLGQNAREYAQRVFGAENAARDFDRLAPHIMRLPKTRKSWAASFRQGALSGAEGFVETLGSHGKIFATSLRGRTYGEILGAEEEISAASYLLSSGDGGIFQYSQVYPADAFLHLWAGLVMQKKANHLEALKEFRAAQNYGFSHWRLAWYLANSLLAMGKGQLAKDLYGLVIHAEPGFEEARKVFNNLSGEAAAPSPQETRFPPLAEPLPMPANPPGHEQNAEQLVLRGKELLRDGKYAAAQRDFLKASILFPESPLGHEMLERVLVEQRER
jgi:glycosyltransferase involved in cell wall biosynthesis